jgi:hypothetical protein
LKQRSGPKSSERIPGQDREGVGGSLVEVINKAGFINLFLEKV